MSQEFPICYIVESANSPKVKLRLFVFYPIKFPCVDYSICYYNIADSENRESSDYF